MANVWGLHVDEVLTFQKTSIDKGLETEEVNRRVQIYGNNALTPQEKVWFECFVFEFNLFIFIGSYHYTLFGKF